MLKCIPTEFKPIFMCIAIKFGKVLREDKKNKKV